MKKRKNNKRHITQEQPKQDKNTQKVKCNVCGRSFETEDPLQEACDDCLNEIGEVILLE